MAIINPSTVNYQLSMERQKIILLLFAVCLFAACSNEDEPINPPLVIRVTENPMTDATAPNNVARRGQVVDNTNFSAFTMRYGNEDTYTYTVTKSGSTWSTTPTSSPSGTNTFYAFSAGTFNWNGGSPYLHFDVDASVAPQKDLVVAKTAPITGNEVDLSFNHICSAVQFKICKTAAMADYVITVTTFDLCNVVNQGDYYFNTEAWSLGSSKTNYTLNTAPITLGTEATDLNLASGSEYLFMIPQTLDAWDKTDISSSPTGCYLRLDCTIQKGGNYVKGYAKNNDAYLPIRGTWEKGKKYIITLNVGTALRDVSGTKIIGL